MLKEMTSVPGIDFCCWLEGDAFVPWVPIEPCRPDRNRGMFSCFINCMKLSAVVIRHIYVQNKWLPHKNWQLCCFLVVLTRYAGGDNNSMADRPPCLPLLPFYGVSRYQVFFMSFLRKILTLLLNLLLFLNIFHYTFARRKVLWM